MREAPLGCDRHGRRYWALSCGDGDAGAGASASAALLWVEPAAIHAGKQYATSEIAAEMPSGGGESLRDAATWRFYLRPRDVNRLVAHLANGWPAEAALKL